MIAEWSAWLFRAENDLEGAKVLLQHNPPQLDIAIYHTQQCAEKALKGFLAFHKHDIPKIHELVKLVALCEAVAPSFIELIDMANFLTPNATEFRYTDNFEEAEEFADLLPDVEDVQISIDFAEHILNFVRQKIEIKTTEHAE